MVKIPKNYMLAIEASIEASKEIVRIYNTPFTKESKIDGSPVTQADLVSSKIISAKLAESNIPIICEEIKAENYSMRKAWEKFWLVDPLDGTKEFIKRNDEFAVNIGLVEHNHPTFGLICSPIEEAVIIGDKHLGVFSFNFANAFTTSRWKKIEPKPLGNPLTIATSRSHRSDLEITFLKDLELKHGKANFILKGSALKFMDLALGRADVYPRFAPTMEWDTAAGQAIIEALGGTLTQEDSNLPLVYNKQDLYNPNFVAKTKAFNQFHEA